MWQFDRSENVRRESCRQFLVLQFQSSRARAQRARLLLLDLAQNCHPAPALAKWQWQPQGLTVQQQLGSRLGAEL